VTIAPTTPEPTPPTLALRPREAARALGIGERKLWELTNRGEIPHAKLGRATVYPIAALERWLAERAEGGRR
jgi:excisionase family DNA binding protein